MQGGRIFYYDAAKNWWSRAGVPARMPMGEPGGPDSEVFYCFEEVAHNPAFGRECHPNCDCGRFLEIGNSVFMQYVKQEDGTFGLLPKQNVDFGGGLERMAMASCGDNDIFAVNHRAIIAQLESLSGKTYGGEPEETRAFRVVADHVKAAAFLIADGVRPGNVERGYVLRRLLRRAVRYADLLGIPEKSFAGLSRSIGEAYRSAYPALIEQESAIRETIEQEEARFRRTLRDALRMFERLYQAGGTGSQEGASESPRKMSSRSAFEIITTYGFPKELVIEEAQRRGVSVPWDEVDRLLEDHRQRSRAGSEQKFRGGLADTAEKTVRLHTAHHLLLRALQAVLGPEVKQRGSNITQERLRIDFFYPHKLTSEQIAEVEGMVNEKIQDDLPVIRCEMSRTEAEALGAEHEFGQKYPDRVSVYSVGPREATPQNPRHQEAFSIEFCGGPHVARTGELALNGKRFKIQKEEAVSAGIRRIRAVLE